MTALERVMQLKREGRSEGEVIATLRAEGVNPMEISDAVNQSKIKEAISDPNPTEGMSPSIMGGQAEIAPAAEAPAEQAYQPQAAPAYQPQAEQSYQPQATPAYQPQAEQSYDNYGGGQPQDDYGMQEQGYADQGGYDDYGGGQMGSTDTMIEVAEQVFLEKMKELAKEIKALTEFKTIFEIKVNNMTSRLERMEKNFDKMQLSILDKVSEYGRGIDHVKKELQMVEDSISKLK